MSEPGGIESAQDRSGGAASRLPRLLWSRGSASLRVLLLAAYLGITAWGVHNHEPLRDEAQKWLLARDAGSVAELLGFLPYEGSPALWPLLLRPLARGGAPYAAMSWLTWAIVGAAASLLLFAAPLPWHLKAAVLFSCGLLYQFPLFANNYSLSLLLLFAALALFARRRERPLALAAAVALLANSSVLGALLALPLAALLGAELARERPASRRRWVALGAVAAGFVLLAAQIVPARLGTGSSIENEFFNEYITARRGVLAIACEAFLPHLTPSMLSEGSVGAAGLLFLLAVAAGLLRRAKALLLLGCAAALYLLLFTHVASAGFRHTVFLLLAVVAALWMAGVEAEEAGGSPRRGAAATGGGTLAEAGAICLASAVIGLSSLGAVKMLRYEAGTMGSRSREAAAAIRDRGLAGRRIVAFPAGAGSAVLPYLPGVKLFYPGLREEGTFVRQGARLWKGETALSTDGVLFGALCGFPGESPLVLLGARPGISWEPFCTSLLSPPTEWGQERYWLYECSTRAPDGRIFPPALCRD